MKYERDGFHISDDRNDIQIERLQALLKSSYWANKRDLETIRCSIENSICFSLFYQQQQIGFARIVTDFSTVAYLADVIIDESYRGQGLGRWLVSTALEDPRWCERFKFLVTDDAQSLYESFGFSGSYKLMSTPV